MIAARGPIFYFLYPLIFFRKFLFYRPFISLHNILIDICQQDTIQKFKYPYYKCCIISVATNKIHLSILLDNRNLFSDPNFLKKELQFWIEKSIIILYWLVTNLPCRHHVNMDFNSVLRNLQFYSYNTSGVCFSIGLAIIILNHAVVPFKVVVITHEYSCFYII